MPNFEGVQDVDGTTFGKTGGKIGFLGAAPSVRMAVTTAPAATASALSSYGYTQAQADAIVTWIRAVDAELKAKGLIASA